MSKPSLRRRIALLFALLPMLMAVAASAADPWNVGDLEQAGQWSIFDRTAHASGLGLPVAAGDLNGDGRADVVLTPMNADSGPGKTRESAGEAVIALSSGTVQGVLDLATLDPRFLPDDVTFVYGADPFDYFGTEVASADVDGDGFDDLIVGAQHGDGPQNDRLGAGEVAIIWGRADIGGRVIDMAELNPEDGVTVIFGAASGDRTGTWVSTGDFDGDGTADVYIGADQASSATGNFHAGRTYVVYGGAALRQRATVDLHAPEAEVEVTTVYGIDREDHSGCTVRGGDLNGDGAAELIIGAGLNRLSSSVDEMGHFSGHGSGGGDGPDNLRNNAGEAYVVYGQKGQRPQAIDLAAPPASTVFVYGRDAGDSYGEELFTGDFNGDGDGDLVVGALTASGLFGTGGNTGQAALIFGGPDLPGSSVDLASPPANVTIFSGATTGEIFGDTALFLDVDADGKDDLAIGAPRAAPGGRASAGILSVFFGTAAPLPATVDAANPPAALTPFVIEGKTAGDLLVYSAAAGDVDNDGIPDLVVNAMGASGFDDKLPVAGEAYVLDGRRVSERAGRRVPVSPSPTSAETATPTASATPTVTTTASATATETAIATATPTSTVTATASATASATPSATTAATFTASATATSSTTPSVPPTASPSPRATATPVPASPSATIPPTTVVPSASPTAIVSQASGCAISSSAGTPRLWPLLAPLLFVLWRRLAWRRAGNRFLLPGGRRSE